MILTVTYKDPNFFPGEGFHPSDATAYDAHYMTKDINKAFTLYEDIIAAHPDTKEAGSDKKKTWKAGSGAEGIHEAILDIVKAMQGLTKFLS